MEFAKKHTTTSEEFGQGLWMLCRKYSKGFYEQFRPEIEKMGLLSKEKEMDFCREIVIVNLWIISRTLSSDKKVIDKLHEFFIWGHRNIVSTEQEKNDMVQFARKDLNDRYKVYDKKWKDHPGDHTSLAVKMLVRMLNLNKSDRRQFNALLTSFINNHILHMMKSVLEFRKDFEIVDK